MAFWLLYCMEPNSKELAILHLEFFRYIPRRFLGLRFEPNLFRGGTEGESDGSLTQFLGCSTRLSLDDVEERDSLYRKGGNSLQVYVMLTFWMA